MTLLDRLFHRGTERDAIQSAARTMGREGVKRQRAKVRANVDAMRKRMGMPPAEWPENRA